MHQSNLPTPPKPTDSRRGPSVLRYCEQCGKPFWARVSLINLGRGRYCSQKCVGSWLSATKTHIKSLQERFESRVEKTESCWLWRGTVELNGYGSIRENKKKLKAHRVSWELHNGPIPDGLFVCHHCDVRNCVNPEHLFLGTCQDNLDDMRSKGRGAVGDRNGMRKHPESRICGDEHWTRKYPERVKRNYTRNPAHVVRGERVTRAKLRAPDVLLIRDAFAHGETKVELARRFGVTPYCIYAVINRLTWKHLPYLSGEDRADSISGL